MSHLNFSSWYHREPCAMNSTAMRRNQLDHLTHTHTHTHNREWQHSTTLVLPRHKPCTVILNRFLEVEATACNISWGLTWALKLRGFHSLRKSSPSLWTIIRNGKLYLPPPPHAYMCTCSSTCARAARAKQNRCVCVCVCVMWRGRTMNQVYVRATASAYHAYVCGGGGGWGVDTHTHLILAK